MPANGFPAPDPAEKASQPSAFDAIAPYYDLLMKDIPYARWKRYVYRLVAEAGKHELLAPGNRVLDLACGTGTLALLLARDGYRVTGVDRSESMIREARRKAAEERLPVEFVVQDASELNVGSYCFAVCISVFDSLNYIVEPNRLRTAFAAVRRALKRGGLFIFDLNTPLALQNRMFDQEDLAPGRPLRYRWRSHYDETTRLCTVRMEFWAADGRGTVSYLRETHVQRAYETEEVLDGLDAAGFRGARAYSAYTLLPPTPASDRVFFVAEATRP